MLLVTEVLCHGQARQCHTHTNTGRLVHLPEYQRCLVGYAAFLHFAPQIVALAATFAYAGKNGIAAVFHGDIVDQLLNEDGFTHAGTAKQADLTTLGVWLQQIDDLDAGLQNVRRRHLLGKGGGGPMDLPARDAIVHRLLAVNGFAQHIEHTPQRFFTHRHRDAVTGGDDGQSAAQSIAVCHYHAADSLIFQMLLHFHGVAMPVGLHGQRLVDGRQLPLREADVDHRAGNTRDNTLFH